MRKTLMSLALWGATLHPAVADRAVLAGLPEVQGQFWAPAPVAAHTRLEQAGFAVRRNSGDIEALRRDLLALMEGTAGEDRLVIHLDGHFVRSDMRSWYLGTTARRTDLLRVGAVGVSLDVVLDIAARSPGGAFVLLGRRDGGPAQGTGLQSGVALPVIPQGVTVIEGPSEALARLAERALYRPGNNLLEAVSGADRVRLSGFAPRGLAIVPLAPSTPDPDVAVGRGEEERAFWDSVRAENTESAYRDYLQRYPNGIFQAQAQRGLADILNDPVRLAQEAEAALALSRADRRRVQADLTDLGYDTRGIDGIFGGGTRAALRAWQDSPDARGIAVTGYLDRTQLARLSRQADAERARRAESSAEDDRLWDRIGGERAAIVDLRTYLDRFPAGRHADTAREILNLASSIEDAPTNRSDRADWLMARRADSAEGYRGYLDLWPRGYFAEEARTRLDRLQGNPEAGLAAARAEEAGLNLNPLTRLLIERRLSQLGFQTGAVDGSFTPETRESLRRFQQDRGLPGHGFVTEETVTRMLAEIGITFSRN